MAETICSSEMFSSTPTSEPKCKTCTTTGMVCTSKFPRCWACSACNRRKASCTAANERASSGELTKRASMAWLEAHWCTSVWANVPKKVKNKKARVAKWRMMNGFFDCDALPYGLPWSRVTLGHKKTQVPLSTWVFRGRSPCQSLAFTLMSSTSNTNAAYGGILPPGWGRAP